ncbi:MAG TPA: hypothetical protein VK590_03730 [Saprospiraceae bacterium]|nr:hypothetical protein [Saprospiraceae bacterium]
MKDAIFIKVDTKAGEINYSFRTYYMQESNRVSCFIPGFNIYFSAEDMEIAHKRGVAMTKFFFRRYTKNDFKSFVKVIEKMGFVKEQPGSIMKRFKKSKVSGNWKSDDPMIPESYIKADFDTVQITQRVPVGS